QVSSLADRHALGWCEYDARVLTVDVSEQSDRDVRSTLLHEMIHAVVGRIGHDARFWAQLEYLLAERAPITIGFPELGESGSLLSVIPRRFRRCHRLFRPVEARYQRRLEAQFRDVEGFTLTCDLMEQECRDAALEGVAWKVLWRYQGRQYGFIDMDGRVLSWGQKYYQAARRGYVRGRRFRREDAALRARFAGRSGTA